VIDVIMGDEKRIGLQIFQTYRKGDHPGETIFQHIAHIGIDNQTEIVGNKQKSALSKPGDFHNMYLPDY
jgi:hypothetical protein